MAGELWSGLIHPAELTGYAREAQADYEQRKGSLKRWLPTRNVHDIVARFFVGRTGLLPVANFRAYDSETKIGTLQGLKRRTIELPPIGQKNRIGEYDTIRQRDGNLQDTVALNSILRMTRTIVRAVSDRMELERGYAIENAALNIDDDDFIQSGSWGRSSSRTQTSDWDDVTADTILEDIDGWVTLMREENGEDPGAMLTSQRVVSKMVRNKSFTALAATIVGGTPQIVTQDHVNQVLQSFNLPPIYKYDRLVNKDGEVQRILSDNKVFFLPEPVANPDNDDNEDYPFGHTFWGRTLEADEPDYGIEAAEQPGIVAATWKTRDPIGTWVHCDAIGLPILANADLSLVATVLPDSS